MQATQAQYVQDKLEILWTVIQIISQRKRRPCGTPHTSIVMKSPTAVLRLPKAIEAYCDIQWEAVNLGHSGRVLRCAYQWSRASSSFGKQLEWQLGYLCQCICEHSVEHYGRNQDRRDTETVGESRQCQQPYAVEVCKLPCWSSELYALARVGIASVAISGPGSFGRAVCECKHNDSNAVSQELAMGQFGLEEVFVETHGKEEHDGAS